MRPTKPTLEHSRIGIIFWIFSILWLMGYGHGWSMDNQDAWGGVPGETLEFDLQWLGIPAGRASIMMTTESVQRVNFEAEARTIGVLKIFGPFHDRIRAIARKGPVDFTSLEVFKDQRKGQDIRLTHDFFDWKNRLLTRNRQGEDLKGLPLEKPGTNDPVTGFFSIRSLPDFGPGKTIQKPMQVGWAIEEVTFRADGVERRLSPVGWFDVFRVRLEIPHSDLFHQPDDLVLWLTADRRRLPIRVESVLRLGRASADLIAYDDGRGGKKSADKEKK
ncbi:MAG: DUF3108 domain-containing protein [Magnetococcales bacterium]|nr:DUF3108 domain-containing protein [Magnetococcales bacterium]